MPTRRAFQRKKLEDFWLCTFWVHLNKLLHSSWFVFVSEPGAAWPADTGIVEAVSSPKVCFHKQNNYQSFVLSLYSNKNRNSFGKQKQSFVLWRTVGFDFPEHDTSYTGKRVSWHVATMDLTPWPWVLKVNVASHVHAEKCGLQHSKPVESFQATRPWVFQTEHVGANYRHGEKIWQNWSVFTKLHNGQISLSYTDHRMYKNILKLMQE